MSLTIETEREVDGRWIAVLPELLGCLAYGSSENQAAAKAEALVLRVLADQLGHGERKPVDVTIRAEATKKKA